MMNEAGLRLRLRLARGFVCGVLTLACVACGPRLDLGSDVTWATDNESGRLDDWSLPPGGGIFQETANDTVTISEGPAHSGRFSVKLSNGGTSDTDGAGVYREMIDPPDAYYSVWYYLPRAYTTNSEWTIQKFRSRLTTDPTMLSNGHDLNLRTLPGGEVILYVVSHDPTNLQAPLANPPAFVPTQAWFHVEVLYRDRLDLTGQVLVWLDDRLVYDLENRHTASTHDLIWSPCSVGEDVTPSPKVIYVDDAAISRTRVTPTGQLF